MTEESKQSEWILEANDQDFQQQVIQRSESTLCLVDFWAEWCGPCRMLGPVLENLARKHNGEFVLVKVDTEKAPRTSANYGIQSIPAVFAFSGGNPIDGFAGALPESQIEEWLKPQLQAHQMGMAIKLVDSDPAAAIGVLTQLAQESPNAAEIQIALAKACMKTGDDQMAAKIIEQLESRGFLEPEAEKIKAALDVKSKSSIDLDAAREKASADPNDLNSQLALANALVGHGKYEDAFEICLELVRKDRSGTGDQARQLMVEVFQTLPPDSDLTQEYRRKLSMALY